MRWGSRRICRWIERRVLRYSHRIDRLKATLLNESLVRLVMRAKSKASCWETAMIMPSFLPNAGTLASWKWWNSFIRSHDQVLPKNAKRPKYVCLRPSADYVERGEDWWSMIFIRNHNLPRWWWWLQYDTVITQSVVSLNSTSLRSSWLVRYESTITPTIKGTPIIKKPALPTQYQIRNLPPLSIAPAWRRPRNW